ncbi:hypothetical protein BK127_09255 [Paenibacillus sp. FSL H7-0331]|jgi:hypothetical protein|nr:hypothetical protein BK127_09255 [Paenibacillus sp. FSL H7-0331]
MGAVGVVSHTIAYVNLSTMERLVTPYQTHIFHESNPQAANQHNIQKVKWKGVGTMGYGAGLGVGCGSCAGFGLGTTTGVILVLFILLVIISRTFI